MTVTEHNVSCVWGGILTGFLLKNDRAISKDFSQTTIKIIAPHGHLDNLNSMLPLAQKLMDRHPNYEIYLFDRAGHGFSSHVPRGFDYSIQHHLQDFRTVIQSLGWNKEKISIIGHSYGATLGILYAASYPEDVLCIVALDALPRTETSTQKFFKVQGTRLDDSLHFYDKPNRNFESELTFEKVLALTKSTRPGITDEAAKLLIERLIRRDADNKLHFTRDESLKLLGPIPSIDVMLETAIQTMKASVLFIGATNPQWPRPQHAIDLMKKYQPNFEVTFIDGPHHLHMTHVDEIVDRIEQYFNKYLHKPSTFSIEKSKL